VDVGYGEIHLGEHFQLESGMEYFILKAKKKILPGNCVIRFVQQANEKKNEGQRKGKVCYQTIVLLLYYAKLMIDRAIHSLMTTATLINPATCPKLRLVIFTSHLLYREVLTKARRRRIFHSIWALEREK
jgi:hypothetical protein